MRELPAANQMPACSTASMVEPSRAGIVKSWRVKAKVVLHGSNSLEDTICNTEALVPGSKTVKRPLLSYVGKRRRLLDSTALSVSSTPGMISTRPICLGKVVGRGVPGGGACGGSTTSWNAIRQVHGRSRFPRIPIVQHITRSTPCAARLALSHSLPHGDNPSSPSPSIQGRFSGFSGLSGPVCHRQRRQITLNPSATRPPAGTASKTSAYRCAMLGLQKLTPAPPVPASPTAAAMPTIYEEAAASVMRSGCATSICPDPSKANHVGSQPLETAAPDAAAARHTHAPTSSLSLASHRS
ncbi:uncharacterized protein B0I36DRAFT_349132 [Microdochium trichocladiopsis]|uniref:Uncharacterized protein n=1 Tax=Microdochium trichocladiopsis TaxID=1682393 RepID=A0A9P8Y8Y9_9PEZI|nr:uncharacterized protein B0I36DRAFT_349132 [Microdochium trichocladiopsis]KAH7030974.1 hypothetical protein B0I36DRAFT_349132 [Microdochium trichocladiopsis]